MLPHSLARKTNFPRIDLIPLLIVLGVSISPVAPQALEVGERSGWVLGLSLGLGEGKIIDSDASGNAYREGITPQWRIGRAWSSHLSTTFEYQGWLFEFGDADVKFRRSLQSWTLAVTWYPGNPANAWNGLWLRAGVGPGLSGTARVFLNEVGEQFDSIRRDEWGVAINAATGYDFWITRRITIGLAANYGYLDIGGDLVREGWFVTSSFGLGWYF